MFLHRELEEEIYMDIPPDFNTHSKGKKVYKLKKALLGLKQSPWAWSRRFVRVMITVGYKQNHDDHTLFIKHSTSGGVTTLLVYVDDITLTRNDLEEREALKRYLAKKFKITKLGRRKYFLGIEVAHLKNEIFVSKQKYVLNLL